jgi:hypothetical protein
MRKLSLPAFVSILVLSVLPAVQPAQAHDVGALHALANVRNLFLVVGSTDRKSINRNSNSDLCLVALTRALQEERFAVVGSRAKADAELTFTGGFITITEGRASKIGSAKLSYAAVVKDKAGSQLWSMVGDADGDSVAEACETAAEDVAEELEEARDEAEDD